jgi:hypothetical protein
VILSISFSTSEVVTDWNTSRTTVQPGYRLEELPEFPFGAEPDLSAPILGDHSG